MDPALEAEFQDDFEDRFADDLDALRDFETDEFFSQPKSDSRTQKPKPHGEVEAAETAKSFLKPDGNVDSSQRPCGPAVGQGASTGPGKGQAERSSRKRDMYEMFGIMSDSEGEDELVIDAPSPVKDPKPKRPRKTLLDRFLDNVSDRLGEAPGPREDEVTPPQSPNKDGAPHIAGLALPLTPSSSIRSSEGGGRGGGSKVKGSARVLRWEPEGASVRVTGQGGRRVYLRLKEDDGSRLQASRKFSSTYGSANTKGLLTHSYDTLMRQIDDENRRKVIDESARVSEKLRRELAKEYEDDVDDDAGDFEPAGENDGKASKGLWVDKYAPRHYTDLLSDDGVNRNLLFWLKMWDCVVFGKDVRQPKHKHEAHKQQQQQQNKFKSKFQTEDLTLELDDQRRPKLKVALLCGPPGLGKTTLAHIIARHAGYNVVEMNASDDRSQEVFKNRLLSTIQMTAVLAPDQRPNCLVIDEIDGAPQAAINCLLNVIRGGAEGGGGGGSKKKKKEQLGPLKRPIICICNDVYVPALKQLRQQAYVTHFPPTVSARLAQRMYQIARKNQLQTDLTALMALCSKAENDIRSCLNTLQFLQQQGKAVTLGVVHSLSVGQKDQHKSLYTVWQQLFQLPKPKKKQYTNPHDLEKGQRSGLRDASLEGLDGDVTSPSARFHHVLHLIQACGEHEKLMQGVFENYLDVKFKDPHMDAINLASDWLVFSDLVQTKIAKTQNYIFGRFLPFVPLTFHMLFACVAYTKIRYPNTNFEVKTKKELTTNLVHAMLSEISPHIRSTVNLRLAVTDLLPPLLIILQPAFRPINTQLFSGAEKKQLKELVDTMIAYNLTYRQERNADGVYNYNLDPNLEVVVRFSDSPPVRQITYAAKQLIAREIELEKMRRTEAAIDRRSERIRSAAPEPSTVKPAGSKLAGSKPAGEKKDSTSTVPRHLQKLQPKKIAVEEEEPMRDFFGRIIQKPAASKEQDGNVEGNQRKAQQAAKKKAKKQLWYSFNTGYSNAVRKNIRIQDLL